MELASMTRDDLIATVLATRAKLEASQERIGVLERRNQALVQGFDDLQYSLPMIARPHFTVPDQELRDND